MSSMPHRFFIAPPLTSDRAKLVGAEAHHLLHVMRATPGDQVILFDGSGHEYVARVDRLGRSDAALTVIESRSVSREPANQTIVGVTLPKGDRQRWLIEKLTELGVARVVPLRAERSVVHPDERALKKLRRFVIEASKQCRRNELMDIASTMTLSEFLTTPPADALRCLADPAGSPARIGPGRDGPVYLAIGPEGGFSPAEAQAARASQWHVVSLGPRVLRIETACVVLAAFASSDLRGSIAEDHGEPTGNAEPS